LLELGALALLLEGVGLERLARGDIRGLAFLLLVACALFLCCACRAFRGFAFLRGFPRFGLAAPRPVTRSISLRRIR